MKGMDMGWEWNWPVYWGKTDYQTIFSLDISSSTGGDHSPSIHVNLVILNCNLLDFGYYNAYHEVDSDLPWDIETIAPKLTKP